MAMIEYTRMTTNSSHEYFSSLLLILVYWPLDLHTVSMHSVILGCFNFHGLVPDPYKYLTCITSFVMVSTSLSPVNIFVLVLTPCEFVCLTEERGNSLPCPHQSLSQFHKPQLIINSPARGPDLVVVTWSLFHTQPPALLSQHVTILPNTSWGSTARIVYNIRPVSESQIHAVI